MVNKLWHAGTSEWDYKHWKDPFYLLKLRQADWFNYYSTHFDTTEINTSFYHLGLFNNDIPGFTYQDAAV